MNSDNKSLTENEHISKVVISFHKKVKKHLIGKTMIDGYTVTIRDAIEAADFIRSFKSLFGIGSAVVLGLSRQYLAKLKNDDKPDVVVMLKELEIVGPSGEVEQVDIDEVLYLEGKSSHSYLDDILGSVEEEQLGNLFKVLTRRSPQSLLDQIDILQKMMFSDEKNVLASAITVLKFLPDSVKKMIIEFGVNIYCEEQKVFSSLIELAASVGDDQWKQQIVENEILTRLWEDVDEDMQDVRINAIHVLSDTIDDGEWKHGIVEDMLLEKLANDDANIRAGAAGVVGAVSVKTGDCNWKKDIVDTHLMPLILDGVGTVASRSLKSIGLLSVGLTDNDWKRGIIKNDLESRMFDNREKVRMAALETIGTMLIKINSFSFIKEIVLEYLIEKLFDERNVQVEVMGALEKIFSTVDDESWKQHIIEHDLLPRLFERREFQTVVISRLHNLLKHIGDDEWKQGIVENSLILKLKSRDWYIHSETLKTLGSMNKCIDNKEWKQRIIEEHFIPRLAFNDKDVQAAAVQAIGELADGNGAEEWRKGIVEVHLLPKLVDESDNGLVASIYKSTGILVAGIEDVEWCEKIVKGNLINNVPDSGNVYPHPAAAEAVCSIMSIFVNKYAGEVEGNCLKNLKEFLEEDASATLKECNYDDKIVETEDDITIGRFTIRKNKISSPHIPDSRESVLINTKTTIEDLEFLTASVLMNKPVLEIGPTATRKSALIQYLAFLSNMPYRRFNLNGQTDKYEFIGGYKPQAITIDFAEAEVMINRTIEDGEYETLVSVVTRLTGEKYTRERAARFAYDALRHGNIYTILNIATLILDKESSLDWQDGILVEALKRGCFLNLDEINLSETEVLERINSLLDDDKSLVVYEHENEKYVSESTYEELVNKHIESGKLEDRDSALESLSDKKVYKIHNNFRLFATMNPKEYKGRNKLSDPFLNRWRILRVEELPDAELAGIMNDKYQTPVELVMPLILFHQSIRDQAENGVLGKRQREEYHFTIRDLMRVFERVESSIRIYADEHEGKKPDIEMIRMIIAEAVHEVYGMVFRDEEDVTKYGDFFKKAFGDGPMQEDDLETEEKRRAYINTQNPSKFIIGNRNNVELAVFEYNLSPYIPGKKSILAPVKTTLKYMKTIARSFKLNEPVHLVGPTASAKTSIIRYMAHLTNTGFQRVSLAGQTDTADIIGQYHSSKIRGRYAWKDGTLLQAMREGDYLLLDELNLAEPQILERINSLLDTGRLVISEHNNETYVRADMYDRMVASGKVDVDDKSFMKIHRNFRIIAASNPVDVRHQGRSRLSLAFRNRFREMWMEEIDDSEELEEIVIDALGKIG